MANKINIEFNHDLHRYTVNGEIYPFVTGIISETVGHGWGAADWYLQRGRAIHACAKLIADGKQFKSDPRLDGYITALRKFFAELKPCEIKSELPVASVIYRFAGMLDLVAMVNGKWCIIDYKHSVDKIRIPLQLAAYSIAFNETLNANLNITYAKEINIGYGVQIRENGTYSMTEAINLKIPRYEFLALRTTYRIKDACGNLSKQKVDKT